MSFMHSLESSRKIWPPASTRFGHVTAESHPFAVPTPTDKMANGIADIGGQELHGNVSKTASPALGGLEGKMLGIVKQFGTYKKLMVICIAVLSVTSVVTLSILSWYIIKNDEQISELQERIDKLDGSNGDSGASDSQGGTTTAASLSTVNLALNKVASQSTTHSDAVASRANDGNADPDWFSSLSCSSTSNSEAVPWWQVDLGAVYTVGRVVISTRGDCSTCGDWLSNVKVEVGDTSASLSLCASQTSFGLGTNETLTCPSNMTGQIVKISMENNNYLQLCEVQVFSN